MNRYDGTLTTIPDETTLRQIGFTDHNPKQWFYTTRTSVPGIAFEVTIDKATLRWNELVVDVDYGQPYHYGQYSYAEQLHTELEQLLSQLREAGVDIRIDHAAYGHHPGTDTTDIVAVEEKLVTAADRIKETISRIHQPGPTTLDNGSPNCDTCEYGNAWPCDTWKAAQENPPAVARITLLHHATSEGFCWGCSYMTEWPCSTFNAATSGDGIRYIRETI